MRFSRTLRLPFKAKRHQKPFLLRALGQHQRLYLVLLRSSRFVFIGVAGSRCCERIEGATRIRNFILNLELPAFSLFQFDTLDGL